MTRQQLLDDCPEGSEEFLESALDEIEQRVNEALSKLKDITRYDSLHLVEDCYDTLEKLARDLY